MSRKIEEILDRLLAEMAQGRTIDECLRDYPEYAEELRPLLMVAGRIATMQKPEPDPDAVRSVIRRARQSGRGSTRFSLRNVFAQVNIPVRVLIALAMIFVFELSTGVLSAESLPGNVLYPVKRLTEGVQHFFIMGTEDRVHVHIALADRRAHEFTCLYEPDARRSAYLLGEMVQEIEQALRHMSCLSGERAARAVAKIYSCHLYQMQVLKDTRESACDCILEDIEQAIMDCMAQRECLECIKRQLESEGTVPQRQDL